MQKHLRAFFYASFEHNTFFNPVPSDSGVKCHLDNKMFLWDSPFFKLPTTKKNPNAFYISYRCLTLQCEHISHQPVMVIAGVCVFVYVCVCPQGGVMVFQKSRNLFSYVNVLWCFALRSLLFTGRNAKWPVQKTERKKKEKKKKKVSITTHFRDSQTKSSLHKAPQGSHTFPQALTSAYSATLKKKNTRIFSIIKPQPRKPLNMNFLRYSQSKHIQTHTHGFKLAEKQTIGQNRTVIHWQ